MPETKGIKRSQKRVYSSSVLSRKQHSWLMAAHAGILGNLWGTYGASLPRKPVITFQKNAHEIHSFLQASVGVRTGGGSFELQMKFIKSNGALHQEPNKVIQTRAGRIRGCLLLRRSDSSAVHPTHICVRLENILFGQPLLSLKTSRFICDL